MIYIFGLTRYKCSKLPWFVRIAEDILKQNNNGIKKAIEYETTNCNRQ